MRRIQERLKALEEEQKRIQFFQRDLPLCQELVAQAIESCRNELSGSTSEPIEGQSEDSERTTSDRGGAAVNEYYKDRAVQSKVEKQKRFQSEPQAQKKQKRVWTPELHRKFLSAIQQLGGAHVGVARPTKIRNVMKVDDLTTKEINSHLQKYRAHLKRQPQVSPPSGREN